MGCCGSNSSTDTPINNTANSSAAPKKASMAGRATESKVELAFKTKRANIFTEGVDFSEEGRTAFVQKRIQKSDKQTKTISKYIDISIRKREKKLIWERLILRFH